MIAGAHGAAVEVLVERLGPDKAAERITKWERWGLDPVHEAERLVAGWRSAGLLGLTAT